MPNLYTITTSSEAESEELAPCEKFSIYYHSLFDYPLNFADLVRWNPGESYPEGFNSKSYICKNGYFTLQAKENLVYKRLLRRRLSAGKMEIAKKAARYFSFFPSIKMVAVTGSLAMGNATDESDIDLLLITGANTLWLTRLLAYCLLKFSKFGIREAKDRNQKDKLCLNMWMDENSLVWRKKDRNYYTAHEIAQIVPLVNKDKTYEQFLYKNKWIRDFWPNAVRINKERSVKSEKFFTLALLERIAYKLQLAHMKPKITREIVTPTRAIFHPNDWGKIINGILQS